MRIRTYPALRTAHLLLGLFALPMLVMYGVSSVQMGHSKWFSLRPATVESEVRLEAGLTDARVVARQLMDQGRVRGEIGPAQAKPGLLTVRVTVPGTVHEIRYAPESGVAQVKTHRAGVMGMLNRLHHAAGIQREFEPLRWWGWLAGVVSFASAGLGVTGLWMWWVRRQERRWGLALLAANLVFSFTVLWLLRSQGLE